MNNNGLLFEILNENECEFRILENEFEFEFLGVLPPNPTPRPRIVSNNEILFNGYEYEIIFEKGINEISFDISNETNENEDLIFGM